MQDKQPWSQMKPQDTITHGRKSSLSDRGSPRPPDGRGVTGESRSAVCSFLGRSRQRKLIHAKRAGWQTFFVPEIHYRTIGPAVAHRHWFGHLGTADLNHMAMYFRLAPDEFFVLPCDSKALQLTTANFQPTAADIIKRDFCHVPFGFDAFIGWTRVGNLFTVSNLARG